MNWSATRMRTPTANSRPADGQRPELWFNPAAFAAPKAGTFGNATRNLCVNPGDSSGTSRSSRTSGWRGRSGAVPHEIFNFINRANWNNVAGTTTTSGFNQVDPTNANFGRVVARTTRAATRN